MISGGAGISSDETYSGNVARQRPRQIGIDDGDDDQLDAAQVHYRSLS